MVDVDGLVATAAYRITQEALTNVARHSFSTLIRISLEIKNGLFNLIVKDNGRGFNPHVLADSLCLGLAGMRERAVLVGGTLDIQSRPGKGTLINFRLPLSSRRVAL
jgi:signal transduction histidine kinase